MTQQTKPNEASDPGEWTTVPFPDCLQPVGFAKPNKIPASEYQAVGRIPVIDQGQDFIAGWTDDEGAEIATRLPFVVFGDHTRAFKFVDFPFALGADGTQLLKPSADFDPRFFYFACLHLPLPNRGYNRHFTVLREQRVPRPSPAVQRKIAAVMSKVERAITVEGELVRTTNELKRAAMARLFSRGLLGSPQRQTEFGPVPEDWVSMALADFGTIVTGTTPRTSERHYYEGGTFHFIAPGDLGKTTRIYRAEKKLTEAGLGVSRVLPKNSVCVVSIGSSIGKVGLTTQERSTTNQQINSIIVSPEFDPLYVCYLLTFSSKYIASLASPSPVPIMSKGAFEQIRIHSSRDIDEQRRIAKILSVLDEKIELHGRRQIALRAVFGSLLDKLMTGEIRVDVLDIEAPPPAAS